MKKNEGITLISLVVTVVVLLIMSAITVNLSMGSLEITKTQNFIASLKVIQSKVDIIAEESDKNTDYKSKYGFTALTEISNEKDKALFTDIIQNPDKYNINKNNSWDSELDSKIENYYYFTPNDLQSKLGLLDQKMTVVINFKTRNVITKNKTKKNKIEYYRQYDFSDGEQKIN